MLERDNIPIMRIEVKKRPFLIPENRKQKTIIKNRTTILSSAINFEGIKFTPLTNERVVDISPYGSAKQNVFTKEQNRTELTMTAKKV